jgi:co-chaperonin GroES (HSP10)
MSKVVLKPMFKRILVELVDVNPHRKTKTDSGLILPDNNIIRLSMDKEANAIVDGGEQRIWYGVVAAVADDCIYAKEGMEVLVDKFAGFTTAMGFPNLYVLPET